MVPFVAIVPKYTAAEVLDGRWWIALVSFAVALVATPIVRAVAYRFKVVDRPDDLLKPHGRPVAYMGGLAMCLGLLAGLATRMAVLPNLEVLWDRLATDLLTLNTSRLLTNKLWNMGAIGLACLLITAVGLLDDLRNLRPRQKVLGQLLAAAMLLAGGIGDRMATVLFSGVGHVPAGWVLLACSAGMCVLAVVAACNAVNLLDGLDGLCGGVTGIISLGFLALAVWLAMWGEGRPDADRMGMRVTLCLAMAGAVLGWLPYNIPPASIFMGDAGSMLLGFFVATMMCMFCQEGNSRWFVASLAVFALPILDTSLAVVRRLRARRSIFAGDRSHLYDQLVDRGMAVKQVVVLFYLLALVAALIGVSVAIFVRLRYALIIYAALLVAIWVVFAKLGMVSPHEAKRSPADGPGNGEARP
jgi:UDP-GlcNAc:undecaprenyl-phosphate GlcNAc-1-phosphate transferase